MKRFNKPTVVIVGSYRNGKSSWLRRNNGEDYYLDCQTMGADYCLWKACIDRKKYDIIVVCFYFYFNNFFFNLI